MSSTAILEPLRIFRDRNTAILIDRIVMAIHHHRGDEKVTEILSRLHDSACSKLIRANKQFSNYELQMIKRYVF